MRHLLGTLLLLAALTGCGDDDGSAADGRDEPAVSGPTTVAVLSASDAGGTVATTATPLPDDAAVAAFAGALDERLGGQVVDAAAAADVPEGQELYGAVVAQGCEPPEQVTTTVEGDAVVVAPVVTAKPGEIQCLVPVTTVALVTVAQGR